VAKQRPQRQLSAILAADVAGYGRLIGVDEEGTLARLKELRRNITDPKISEHRGRIVKTMGDGLLVQFGSAVDAVRCAVEIQRQIAEQNAEIGEDRRIEFRIGINVGDVVLDGDDIYGDGVNISARLEALADPGGICVSSSVRDQVRDKLDLAFEDTGKKQLKNIAHAIRVYRVLLGRGTTMPRPALSLPDKPSIAILPFDNMSGDSEQDYFADGMVEEIITALSRFKHLFVIARNSSFIYKGRAVDVKQVGRELAVRYVLQGSVRKAGNRVRITGQLIDAQSGAHLWADRFDGAQEDIFDLQDKITETVVGIVEPQIRKAEIARSRRKRPEKLDAYDLYLRALPHLYAMRSDDNTQALYFLTRAIDLDPDFAPALAFTAWCYEQRLTRGWNTVCETDSETALRLARAALETGSDDANAVGIAGFVLLMIGHEYALGLSALRRAVQSNPNNVLILSHAGFAYCMAGDLQEAIQCFQRAQRLSPMDPGAFFFFTGEAQALLFSGRYSDAAELARHSAAIYDGWDSTYWFLAAAYGHLGHVEEARKTIAKILSMSPSTTVSNIRKLPYDETRLAILLNGLRKAGLPE